MRGIVWVDDDPLLDPEFVAYVEAILNCQCCQNNYSDLDHHHSDMCNESIEIKDQEV